MENTPVSSRRNSLASPLFSFLPSLPESSSPVSNNCFSIIYKHTNTNTSHLYLSHAQTHFYFYKHARSQNHTSLVKTPTRLEQAKCRLFGTQSHTYAHTHFSVYFVVFTHNRKWIKNDRYCWIKYHFIFIIKTSCLFSFLLIYTNTANLKYIYSIIRIKSSKN